MSHSMRNLTLAVALVGTTLAAGAREPAGGGAWPLMPTDEISDAQRADIQAEIRSNLERLQAEGHLPEARGGAVAFEWPLGTAPRLNDAGYHGISNFVDQDPAVPNQLLDYECGARTYDLGGGYNHQGVDFFTWPFGWRKMDNDEVTVIAAAPGVIAARADGNFDRSCGFNSNPWNAVYVRHADNSITWYGHLKSGSVTPKQVGDTVSTGEVLGVVGSSGSSTGPHLHMETYDGDGNLIEPYAGACNGMNDNTWWADQRAYYDSALNAVTTGSAPVQFQTCPTAAIPNTRRVFAGGEQVYLTTYYRDQLQPQTSLHTVRFPNGSIATQWSWNSDAAHYAASYWFWFINTAAGGPFGTWTFTVDYEGSSTTVEFDVVPVADGDSDGINDHLDNCMSRANPSQIDADDDGYGNACDADYNNDGIVNVVDLGVMRANFFGNDPVVDLDGNGVVNVVDLGILRTQFFQSPGPSAFAP